MKDKGTQTIAFTALTLSLALALPGITHADRITSYTYNALGLVETVDGPRVDVDDITTYGYDDNGNRTSTTNALGRVTRVTEYDGVGRPLTIVDPNGLTTSLSYDPRGRLTGQTLSDGATTRTTVYDYDPVGNLIRVTLSDGSYIQYDYDPAHRLIGIEDSQGNRIDYSLDAMGNRESEEVRDPSGTLTRRQQQVFDGLGRVQVLIDSQNHTTEYDYDANGNLTQTIDANNHPSNQTYDALDRLDQQTDALDGVTQYSYDAQDNLTSVTDPNGLTTTYAYDGLGNLLSQTSPDTGTTSYSYDEAGNRLTQTDARGISVSYSYDALNRLTQVSYPDASLNVSYDYDQGPNGIGRLTRISDANGTTDYTYNAYGELTSQTRTSSDGIVTTYAYGYDAHGRLTSLTYPSGNIVHYAYDTHGQLADLTFEQSDGSSHPLVNNLQTLPFGPIQTLDYGNGLSLSRTFDQDYRLIGQTINGILQSSYGHDPVGNITDWLDQLDTSQQQQFGYDELDRLTTALGSYGSLGYNYDAIGNRLSKTEEGATETYNYSLDSHQLQQIIGATTDDRSYDEAGNTLQSLIGSYTYDDTNRMVSYSNPQITASYAYNGKGERIRKSVNGETTRFRYGADGVLLGEYDQTGQAIREYVYLAGQPVALIREQQGAAVTLLQSVNLNHVSQTIDLGQHSATPVIIASPLTFNGGQGAVVGLENITTTQASVQVKEWDYLDGPHLPEDLSLLALPPGRYPQADGSIWEVGRFTLSGTRQWHNISFNEAFAGAPHLFLTQQSQNDIETTSVRARNVNETGFQAYLQEQESLNNGHGAESIGYLAIYSPAQGGTATFYGSSFDYQLSQQTLNHTWTAHGDQQLLIQEEASRDSELAHAAESLDILQIEGHLFAQDVTTNGGDTTSLRRRGPTSTVLLSSNSSEQGVVYLHTDHLGAVVKATDGDQGVVWDVVRKPFGERTVVVGQVEMPLGFPGQYYDEETGNYYNYFRDYDPATGRYLQSDPIGLDGGLNTYLYANANPVIFFDATGLVVCSCAAKQTGGRDRKTGEKICTYYCSCQDCGKIKIKVSAGSSGSALCKGQEEWVFPPAVTTKFSSFDMDTDSWWDRMWNDDFVDEINKKCPECEQ
ncbi:MAG: RHS repeat-associated core domain-containing protein [Candidatus Thiodiazotropha sp.]